MGHPIIENIPGLREARRSKRFHLLADILITARSRVCGQRDFVAMRDF